MHIQTIHFEYDGFLGVMEVHRNLQDENYIFIRLGNAGASIESWSNPVIQAILDTRSSWMIYGDAKKFMIDVMNQSRPWIR